MQHLEIIDGKVNSIVWCSKKLEIPGFIAYEESDVGLNDKISDYEEYEIKNNKGEVLGKGLKKINENN